MKFFVLKSPDVGSGMTANTNFLRADYTLTGDAPRCQLCGNPVSMRPLLPPVGVEIESNGSCWGDLAFGVGIQILVSEKLRLVSAQANIKGFIRLDPVTIEKVRRRCPSIKGPPPQYWLATIARSRAIIDDDASGLKREGGTQCPECGLGGTIKRARRIVLRPNTWSDEDIFYARGLPGTILVSDRFKALCESKNIANCLPIPADMCAFDFYPQDPQDRNSGDMYGRPPGCKGPD